jgi:hypothetical protein
MGVCKVDKNFKGYIKPKKEMEHEGEFILQPVYVVPVEVFSRGFLRRPEYKYYQAVVDASTGNAEFLPAGTVRVTEEEPPAGKVLPIAINASQAAALAETDAGRTGREGWRSVLGSAHAIARSEGLVATWRVWILSGDIMIDTLTERTIEGALFLADFLDHGGKGAE